MKNMYKGLLICLTALVLIFGVFQTAMMETYPFSAFIQENVRMRKEASSESEELITLPKGDSAYIVGEKNGYYIAQYEGTQGYVLKAYISSVQPSDIVTATQQPASEDEALRYQTLYLNSEGKQVEALQMALQELGFYKGKIDQDYGQGTLDAVKKFQKENKLVVTGAADAKTQGLMFEGNPKNSKGKGQFVSVLPNIDQVKISLNKKGEAVITLKNRLMELAYLKKSTSNVYDKETKDAVVAFQKANGLKADGIAGVETLNKVYDPKTLLKGQTPPPVLTPTDRPVQGEPTYPYETVADASVMLRKYASLSSSRITTIQKGDVVTVLEQKEDFLKVEYKKWTGYCVAAYILVPDAYLPSSAKDYPTLKKGDAGYTVQALQEALKELRFYSGKIDGEFSTSLQTSVKSFQQRNKYQITGVMTSTQQEHLYEEKVKNSAGKSVEVKMLPPNKVCTMEYLDKGKQVQDLKGTLSNLGYYKGEMDNVFDADTRNAVKAFQKARGLFVDGKVGPKTLEVLAYISNTPTPAPTLDPSLPQATEEPLTEDNVIVMQNGTRGVAVKKLQERLVALGYYQIVPDGIYDSNDIQAVRSFQKKNGLKADGVAGLETQVLLYSNYAQNNFTPAPTSISTPEPVPTVTPDATEDVEFDKTIALGATGDKVRALQERLKALGYIDTLPDGIFGKNTEKALKKFQSVHKLDQDGKAGTKTWTMLFDEKAQKNPSSVEEDQQEELLKDMRLNDYGEHVRKMQRRLIDLKYLDKADGNFGPKTFAAVLRFEEKNKLKVDGVVTQNDLKVMNGKNAVPNKEGNVQEPSTPSVPDYDIIPKAKEVRYANWYTEIRSRARSMPDVTIYDPDTKLSYKLHMFSFGKHADAEPPTKEDTEIMRKVCGNNSWTPHPVWVIFEDGRVYMASTHSHGHTVDHTSGNDLVGHICLHFPRLMAEAQLTGPYAVSHQNAILLGWDRTQAMIQ